MGLLSFVKSAGKAIFGSDEEEKKIEREMEAKAAAQREKLEELKKARAIMNRISEQKLDVDGLRVTVDDGKVTLDGTVSDQATSEKVALTAGNLGGISAVDNRLVVENPEPEATFYTVEKGDNLSKIAKEQYGDASKYPVIFEANKPMLSDPDKIYPGQVLRIPPVQD